MVQNTTLPAITHIAHLKKPCDIVNNQDDNLIALIEILEQINTEQVASKLNETSISDNNGSRIFF